MGTRAMGWFTLLTTLSALLSGCATENSPAKPAHAAKVLIIGDSISIGYFEPTKQLLAGKAEVYHNPGNAAHTRHGLAELDAWLGDTSWDVIHFNHGLHDLKYVNAKGERVPPAEGVPQVPIDEYARNLEQLVERLRRTRARLIFATTTPVPEGALGRVKGDAERYNRVAVPIMRRHGVWVNDLYAFALPRLETIQRPHDVHFTPEGSRLLAEQVADSILHAIGAR